MNTKKLTIAGICLAACLLLPFLTGQIPQIGNMLSPMHIPVLICGFVCGWKYGLAVGLIAPLLRYVLFGSPPIISAIAMTTELAAYGAVSGLLYNLMPKKIPFVYIALIVSMLLGRAIWGVTMWALAMGGLAEFSFEIFLTGAFITSVPGIITHIIIIPVLVLALKRAGLMLNE